MEDTVKITTHAMRVRQRPPLLPQNNVNDISFNNLHDFFVFSLPSPTLTEIAKFLGRHESRQGVQRKHQDSRDKEIGKFICSDNPFFPNNIILNIPLEFEENWYDENTMLLDICVKKSSAYVIDGQHRLKAFQSEFARGAHLPLVVSAYFGLELPTIAEIFTRINFFQKPVSKSVVYDLLELNKDPEFIKYHDAHRICEKLNSTIGSPFYNLVKMLGIGSGLLSQAALVEAISTRYKIVPMLIDKGLKAEEITIILFAYFNAVKISFPEKWGNSESILSRSVGFNALVKILQEILVAHPEARTINSQFSTYTTAMATINVDSEEIRSFGGFKGVNALADKFRHILSEGHLL